MIKEYLGRVSVAATKVLPKGDRLLFVGRTRAAIEARVGPLASAEADDVASALTALGEPEDLAQRERERLFTARRRGAAAAPPTLWKPGKESRRRALPPSPPPARRPGPAQARKPRPWPHRGLAGPEEPQPAGSAPQPAGSAPEPSPGQEVPPATVPAVPRQAHSPEAAPSPPAAGPTPHDTPHDTLAAQVTGAQAGGDLVGAEVAGGDQVDAQAAGGELADEDVPTAESPAAESPNAGAPAPEDPGGQAPGWLRPRAAPAAGEPTPASIVPGMGQPGQADEPPPARWRPLAAAPLAEAWALARKHPLEAVSIVLLGLGGLILPFPFWPIGWLVSIKSRRWDARDKWMALAGPPLFTLAVLVIRAATSPGNFFSAFYQAAHHDVGLSIRAGCVLCAGYLVWRLRRGPRVRSLPPWQRPR